MKKITTLIVGLLITIASFSQRTVIAKNTEIYKWNKYSEKWEFSSSNKNTDIPIYIFKRFIHIQAKDNAYFLLEETSEDISGETFKGFSYRAYEFVTESKCEIHVVDSNDGQTMISVVWFSEGVNLRYFLK
jgi:hypothetical protein